MSNVEKQGPVAFILGTDPRARDLRSRAAIIRFSAIAVIVYTVLVVFQPALHRAYGYWFRGLGSAMFSRIGGDGSVHFLDLNSDRLFEELDAVTPGTLPAGLKLPRAEGEKDTLLVLQNRRHPGSIGLFRSGSRLMAFIPIALFFSLFVATPLPWLQRLVLLGAGLIAVHAFILFRIWLYVLSVGFADPSKKYHLYEPGGLAADLLGRAKNVLVDDPTFHYVVPVVIWAVVMLAISVWTRRRTRGGT